MGYIYDNTYLDGGVVRVEKSRVYKCVDRQGKFLWWEWLVSDDILIIEDVFEGEPIRVAAFDPATVKSVEDYEAAIDRAAENATCGCSDFTVDGNWLGLTEIERGRALIRKVKL